MIIKINSKTLVDLFATGTNSDLYLSGWEVEPRHVHIFGYELFTYVIYRKPLIK